MIEVLDEWVDSGGAYTLLMLLLTLLLYVSWRSGWLGELVAFAPQLSNDSADPIPHLYRGSQPVKTAEWHGLPGWEGVDWAAGCGTPLYAPISGIVTFNGLDGYVGPYAGGQQNTMLIIHNGEQEVVLFHGQFIVPVGCSLQQGETPIGW